MARLTHAVATKYVIYIVPVHCVCRFPVLQGNRLFKMRGIFFTAEFIVVYNCAASNSRIYFISLKPLSVKLLFVLFSFLT